MLQGEHITVRYGNFTVVDDLSFHLEEGRMADAGRPERRRKIHSD